MGIGKDFRELMAKVGYSFNDLKYLENALTHTSYTNEMRKKGFRADSYETLEFLGDAVLEFVVSEELFRRYSKDGEGALTKIRQELVCESTLARLARVYNLGAYLNIGTAEESTKLRDRSKVLADAFEALVAAIYLDDMPVGGLKYKAVILALFADEISSAVSLGSSDYKTMLQSFVEKNSGDVLTYRIEESGPAHAKHFVATAYINNNRVGSGSGLTKRGAEQAAAEDALGLFGII